MATETIRKQYGVNSLKTLLKKFNLTEIEGLVEWEKFKIFIQNNYKTEKENIWTSVLNCETFQQLRLLFQIYLVIPLSTSGCERVFFENEHYSN